MTLTLFWENAALLALMMGALWVWSLWRRDASVVDPWWPLGYLLVAWHSGLGMPWTEGRLTLLALVAVWALRLAGYLFRRGWGQGEDPRYQAFRQRYGPQRYWWVSLFQVFLLQGSLILALSWPLQLAMSKAPPDQLGANDLLGAALVVLGLGIEALADAQLAAFRSRPENAGRVLDQGLWRYSRHPNYFGESVVWWGFWVSTWDAGWAALTMLSPVVMTFLLLRVSGVAMLEPALLARKPGYADYVARTSAFVPWPPRAC